MHKPSQILIGPFFEGILMLISLIHSVSERLLNRITLAFLFNLLDKYLKC